MLLYFVFDPNSEILLKVVLNTITQLIFEAKNMFNSKEKNAHKYTDFIILKIFQPQQNHINKCFL
jgi:hypothetical protein